MTTAWTSTTPAEVESKIQEMVRRIIEGFHPDKIILFGSRARGDAQPDSDVDLLVVIPTLAKKETMLGIRLAVRRMGISKDIVVVTPEEFEQRKNIVGTMAYPAHHEGRVLYERSAGAHVPSREEARAALAAARRIRSTIRTRLPSAAIEPRP